MSDNKSLCDSCLYRNSCERSDAGISGANHSVCYGYVADGTEEGGAESYSIRFKAKEADV